MSSADTSPGNAEFSALLERADGLLARLEQYLPPPPTVDWSAHAWRWRRGGWNGISGQRGWLEPVHRPHAMRLEDLCCIEPQRDELDRNTRQFLAGGGANNVLLSGARGTGKSSLVKAAFNSYRTLGLRLIEVDKDELTDLPSILSLIEGRDERFILYCDDLSFEAGEGSYKALKAALDGSISAAPDNVLIYATSNRRHLLPEFQHENRETRLIDAEIHHGESVEEKISLSDRFGLWLSFQPFSQGQYLKVCRHWLARLGAADPAGPDVERAALQWALRRGSRSGRTAYQFARDQAGRALVDAGNTSNTR
jgi:predicted AAA+ superfamily ATPase